MIYIKLYLEFFKAGLFAIGGGLAALPFLENISEKTGWFTKLDLANMIAVGESTPGPIGVNVATYAGYMTSGVPGTLAATLGLISPSIIIILLISSSLEKYRSAKLVDSIFYGLRPASAALICAAGLSLMKLSIVDLKGIFLGMIIFFLIWKFDKHPLYYIALSAIVGIIFKF
jgi:chromate transporter